MEARRYNPGAMERRPESPASVEFGRFKVDRHRRELIADGYPVELGSRAFDTLIALIDARGTVLSKDELLSHVWPGQVVEENNLHAQISILRRAFGADRDLIRTVAGRGYQFTGTVAAVSATRVSHRLTNLPEPVTGLIGREEALGAVADLVAAHRLVTLIGAGGVGKTSLALEVGRRAIARFPDGVWLAELGSAYDPQLVAAIVATALGVTLGSASVTSERVAAATAGRRILLLLDNCEHLIDAAARMAEALVSKGAQPRILATSREPLRAADEHVYRVPSLSVPAEDNMDVNDVLQYGAVRLFSARARALEARSVANTRHVAAVAAICRRLDGIPLAIELAAARVPAFGVDGIAARLNDRFRLLSSGQRTALTRHQTLRATLDWSHELLSETERVVLRRLGVFAGSFSVDAASAVAADVDCPAPDVVECVARLVSRSLLATHLTGAAVRYRLLETTRAYASERLADAGERERFARRHASYFRDVIERAEAEWKTRPTADWLASYTPALDDVRTALDWAFAPGGDTGIGTALTIVAVPLWLELGLLNEFLARIQHACTIYEAGTRRDPSLELRLYAALAISLVNTRGPRPETDATWTKVLGMAEELGDEEYQLRALWGLYACRNVSGSGRIGLALARRFAAIAATRPDPVDRAIAERLIGTSLHYIGEQSTARAHIERMLELHPPRTSVHQSQTLRFFFDQRTLAYTILTHVLWLQGAPDQALVSARQAVDEAHAAGDHPSLCFALCEAASRIALYTGDLPALETSVTILLDVANKHASAPWHAAGRCLQGLLFVTRGDAVANSRIVQPAFAELGGARFFFHYTGFLAALADALLNAGRPSEARAALDEAFARCKATEEHWSMPELLRVRSELLVREGAAREAEAQLEQALALARQQDVLSWELRCAMSLARLQQRQHRTSLARRTLAPVYRRFTEGFQTSDLVAAEELLTALA